LFIKSGDDSVTVYDEPYLEEGKNEISYGGHFTPDFKLEEICDNPINPVSCNVNGTIQIPDGYYLVLGDNRPNSHDSTEIGLIKTDTLLGEAKFIIYPFNRFGKINK